MNEIENGVQHGERSSEPVTQSAHVNGIRLCYWDIGRGPALLLLHGFPDSKQLWRHAVDPLRAAGYRVIVPDLRGFGESERPSTVDAYSLTHVVADVIGLLDALQIAACDIVAHDWGAPVAWSMALVAPARIRRQVALTVGHPAYFQRPSLEQRRLSWYMLLFQFEGVAEALLEQDNWALFRDFVGHHPECERWVSDLSRPGALTAGLSWYRANMHPAATVGEVPALPAVTVPTLGIWASGDAYLAEACVTSSAERVSAEWRYERLDGVGHWIPLDAPDRMVGLVLDWLGHPSANRTPKGAPERHVVGRPGELGSDGVIAEPSARV